MTQNYKCIRCQRDAETQFSVEWGLLEVEETISFERYNEEKQRTMKRTYESLGVVSKSICNRCITMRLNIYFTYAAAVIVLYVIAMITIYYYMQDDVDYGNVNLFTSIIFFGFLFALFASFPLSCDGIGKDFVWQKVEKRINEAYFPEGEFKFNDEKDFGEGCSNIYSVRRFIDRTPKDVKHWDRTQRIHSTEPLKPLNLDDI